MTFLSCLPSAVFMALVFTPAAFAGVVGGVPELDMASLGSIIAGATGSYFVFKTMRSAKKQ